MKNNKVVKFIGLVFLVFMLVYLARESGLVEFLDVDNSKDRIARFGILAPIVFVVIFILATISFLPVTPLDLVAGALFGTFWGVVYVVIGGTLGAMIAFWFTRTFGRVFVQKHLIERFPNIERYNNKIEQRGLSIMFVLRLVPLFPFNGLNFAMGLTKIKTRDYFIATFFGIIPGAFAYVYFGDALVSADFSSLASAVFVLLLLTLIYPFYNKFRKKEENEFDIIVVGAGAAGLNIASFMNKAGFKVLLIEKDRNNVGGDCLNFGCIPSKSLIYISRLARSVREAKKYGTGFEGAFDMRKIKKHIKSVKERIRKHESVEYFRKQGMKVVVGQASFSAENEIIVGGKKYNSERIIVATGSRPKKFKVAGIEKVRQLTNENVFDLKEIPKRLLVIGGGPIGVELGQAFSSLGSEVSIVQQGSEILAKERPEIASILREKLEDEGVRVFCNSRVKEFISANKAVISSKENGDMLLDFDAIFVSVGRGLDFSGLNLTKAGIKTKKGRVELDGYLRSSNKRVLFVGDAAGGAMFTHATELHAATVLRNFFSPIKRKLSYDNFSWVTYTSPEIATFGLSEKELKKRGVRYQILEKSLTKDDRALTDNYTYGKAILYLDGKERILGGTLIVPMAGELVQELLLAMSAKLKVGEIFKKIYPYPTASRINKTLVSEVYSEKLNSNFNRKLLRLIYH